MNLLGAEHEKKFNAKKNCCKNYLQRKISLPGLPFCTLKKGEEEEKETF